MALLMMNRHAKDRRGRCQLARTRRHQHRREDEHGRCKVQARFQLSVPSASASTIMRAGRTNERAAAVARLCAGMLATVMSQADTQALQPPRTSPPRRSWPLSKVMAVQVSGP
jgi:hypothetical protein